VKKEDRKKESAKRKKNELESDTVEKKKYGCGEGVERRRWKSFGRDVKF